MNLNGVNFYNVSSSSSGSIIYGTYPTSYLLTSSLFTCKGSPYTTNEPALSGQIHDIGGAFYLVGSASISVNAITVNNCYIGDVGGAFYIESTTLTDTGGSSYNYNAAIKGGQLHCKNCRLNIYNAVY